MKDCAFLRYLQQLISISNTIHRHAAGFRPFAAAGFRWGRAVKFCCLWNPLQKSLRCQNMQGLREYWFVGHYTLLSSTLCIWMVMSVCPSVRPHVSNRLDGSRLNLICTISHRRQPRNSRFFAFTLIRVKWIECFIKGNHICCVR
jgi:hypothetical protein